MRIWIVTLCWLSLSLSGLSLMGQALPPLQPEQDCINAIPVCGNFYSQPNSYQGEGLITAEIDSTNSCLSSGEENDVWYIFTVQVAGDLCFTLTPTNGVDDYDWAVYDLTNNPCSDIFALAPTLEVGCNYSGATGCGGITGANGNFGCGPQNDPCIPVQAGETYVLNVSNFSGTGSGYDLDFSQSSAVIFDNIPPTIDSLSLTCAGEIEVFFSENVLCSSLDSADFLVTTALGDTIPVLGTNAAACNLGGTFESSVVLSLGANPTPGQVNVRVDGTITDNCGNAALLTEMDSLIWAPQPGPLFISATDDSICAGETVTLTIPGTPGATYAWSVAGTDTFLTVSPTTTTQYQATATDSTGCLRSDSLTIVVNPTPTATFTATPQACVDSVVAISYQGSAGASATYDWDFAGAMVLSGSGAGPYEITFGSGGLYSMSLVVRENGCASDTFFVDVDVPPRPTAQLDLPPQACLDERATLGVQPPASPTAVYTWDFDGGIAVSGSGAGPYEVEWPTPGQKQVCLIVEEAGCFSLPVCQPIQVDVPPGGNIAPQDPQCLGGNEFTFAYQGAGVSAYHWELGEAGDTSVSNAPLVIYDSAGTKQVTVVVTDANGCTSEDTLLVEVLPMPTADFAADTVCAGEVTRFFDQSSAQPGHGLDAWSWGLGDGSSSDQINPQHIYPGPGRYDVRLLVTSVDGCADSITQTIPVRANPVADFTFGRFCVDQSAPLRNTSQAPNAPAGYRWEFSDGSISEAFEPFFSADSSGSRPITLTVTNAFGCTDAFTDTIQVFGLPGADFESGPTCEGQAMALRSTVETAPGDSIARYEWLLGDGSRAMGAEIEHLYPEPGRYLITHKVETTLGCRDSVADSVIVWANPQAAFQHEDACVDDPMPFQSTSAPFFRFGGTISSLRWDFGGLGVGTGPTPTFTYPLPGDYVVQLIAETDRGCADTVLRSVTAYRRPEAPQAIGDSLCAGEFATLRAQPDAFTDLIFWYDAPQGGNLVGSDTLFRTELLSQPTTFYAVAESRQGCASEPTPVPVVVAPRPEGEILATDEVVEMPDATVSFALAGNFAGVDFRWDFGDDSSSTEAAPTHTFGAVGQRRVTVEVTTAEGCYAFLETLITVIRRFNLSVPSAFTPNDDGVNDRFFLGPNQVGSLQFVVYNRWGQVVFEADEPDFQWDGHGQAGRPLPGGVYVYRATGVDATGRSFDLQGSITLLR